MAYVLGFFAADGSMNHNRRGAHYITLEITDRDLLCKIQNVLGLNHKITKRERERNRIPSYRLQIGSKTMFADLIKLGITPQKSKTIRLPYVPEKYFKHFVWGYFDGDGNVVSGFFRSRDRKNPRRVLLTRFTSGSEAFMKNMMGKLSRMGGTRGSILYYGDAWRLSYSHVDSRKLYDFMYTERHPHNLIYLPRKYKIFQNAGVA